MFTGGTVLRNLEPECENNYLVISLYVKNLKYWLFSGLQTLSMLCTERGKSVKQKNEVWECRTHECLFTTQENLHP